MSPWQVGVVLIGALIAGGIGALIGRIRGRGKAGFWFGFFLSVLGIVIIAIVVAVPSEDHKKATEEARIQQAADRLRIEKEAARRVAAEGDQQP